MAMINRNKLGSALCFMLLAHPAQACSVLPTYEPFRVDAVRPTAARVGAPVVTVEHIVRGSEGDGGTCADLGFLVFKVPTQTLGYRFVLVSGRLGDTVFPDGFVRPKERGRLGFVWLDGNTAVQEPIDVVVRITVLTPDGVLSEPLHLNITHPGVSAGAR